MASPGSLWTALGRLLGRPKWTWVALVWLLGALGLAKMAPGGVLGGSWAGSGPSRRRPGGLVPQYYAFFCPKCTKWSLRSLSFPGELSRTAIYCGDDLDRATAPRRPAADPLDRPKLSLNRTMNLHRQNASNGLRHVDRMFVKFACKQRYLVPVVSSFGAHR